MTLTKSKLLVFGGIGIVALSLALLALFSITPEKAGAAITFSTSTVTPGSYKYTTFFSATTTTATSTNTSDGGGYLVIAGAKKVQMYFSRGDISGQGNSGSTLFKVQVTPDGINWYDFNRMSQNVATSTSEWEVGSVTITAATSTTITSLDLRTSGFYAVRCIAVETTDGEHTCKGAAEY